jgi:hypothetical protein
MTEIARALDEALRRAARAEAQVAGFIAERRRATWYAGEASRLQDQNVLLHAQVEALARADADGACAKVASDAPWRGLVLSWRDLTRGVDAGAAPVVLRTPPRPWDYGALSDPISAAGGGRLRLDLHVGGGDVGVFLTDERAAGALSAELSLSPARDVQCVSLDVPDTGAPLRLVLRSFGDGGRAAEVEVLRVQLQSIRSPGPGPAVARARAWSPMTVQWALAGSDGPWCLAPSVFPTPAAAWGYAVVSEVIAAISEIDRVLEVGLIAHGVRLGVLAVSAESGEVLADEVVAFDDDVPAMGQLVVAGDSGPFRLVVRNYGEGCEGGGVTVLYVRVRPT